MRIIISGSVVSNGGDAAIMEAQLHELRRVFPDARFLILDSVPGVSRRLFPAAVSRQPLIPFARRRRAKGVGDAVFAVFRRHVLLAARRRAAGRPAGPLLRVEREYLTAFGAADLVAYTGGTTLLEQYVPKWKLLELEVAAALGVPIVLLPQSIGRLAARSTIDRLGPLVGGAHRVLLRDPRSRTHLEAIGADLGRVRVVPDIVFALLEAGAPDRMRRSEVPATGPRVVVSARDIAAFASDGEAGQARFDRSIAAAVTALVRERGAEVVFLSTCQGLPDYSHDDSRVARRIADALPLDVAEHVRVDEAFHSPEALHAEFAAFDFALVTRLHAGITALNVGTPVVAIAYEFKTQEVLDQVGLGDFVTTVDDLTPDGLVRVVEAFLEALPRRRPSVATRLGELRDGVTDAMDEMARSL